MTCRGELHPQWGRSKIDSPAHCSEREGIEEFRDGWSQVRGWSTLFQLVWLVCVRHLLLDDREGVGLCVEHPVLERKMVVIREQQEQISEGRRARLSLVQTLISDQHEALREPRYLHQQPPLLVDVHECISLRERPLDV